MARKKQRPRPDEDREQYKRFRDTAKEVEAEDDPKAFDRAFRKVTQPPRKG